LHPEKLQTKLCFIRTRAVLREGYTSSKYSNIIFHTPPDKNEMCDLIAIFYFVWSDTDTVWIWYKTAGEALSPGIVLICVYKQGFHYPPAKSNLALKQPTSEAAKRSTLNAQHLTLNAECYFLPFRMAQNFVSVTSICKKINIFSVTFAFVQK